MDNNDVIHQTRVHRHAPVFSACDLNLDPQRALPVTTDAIRNQVLKRLRRNGAVIGLSGGIDSSTTAALCVAALGADKVLCLLMPERDSDPDSLHLGRLVVSALGTNSIVEDIGPILMASGCYERRDDAIRKVVPEFGPGWGCKVVIDTATYGGYNISSLVVRSPQGESWKVRMPLPVYEAVIAATNMKQRTRKQLEYYHADRLHYAVAGTPNRLEYDQGFFVKNGDGAADFKPIAHLYKSQVYQLARLLGIPEEVCNRPPTTDTWSIPQTQHEFYFSLPFQQMDLCLLGLNRGVSAQETGSAAGLTAAQVEHVWRDIAFKRRATSYLHQAPLLVEPVLQA
jgi:NAD+ synthase